MLDETLRAFAADEGAAALPVLSTLSEKAARPVRRAAKLALYRLAQQGVVAPRPTSPRHVVEREAERATRAWISARRRHRVAGGVDPLPGTVRRGRPVFPDLQRHDRDRRGRRWRYHQEALRARTRRAATVADPAVGRDRPRARRQAGGENRWLCTRRSGRLLPLGSPAGRQRSPSVDAAPGHDVPDPSPAAPPDPALLERSAALLDLPEFAGWFLDPEALQSDSVALLQTRESRLVVSDQVKAEREAAIVDGVIARELTPPGAPAMGAAAGGDGADSGRHRSS